MRGGAWWCVYGLGFLLGLGLVDAAEDGPLYQQTAILPVLSGDLLQQFTNSGEQSDARRLQIGLHRALPAPLSVERTRSADWRRTREGRGRYTALVAAPGAAGLRLKFEDLHLPKGARLVLTDASGAGRGEQVLEPTPGTTELWAPAMFTDAVEIRCEIPAGCDPASVTFKVSSVSHLYSTSRSATAGDDTCLPDLACYGGYGRQASAVALMTYVDRGNTYVCTGSLVEGPKSGVEYFLTANHCIYNQSLASSIELFWFYESEACNGNSPTLDQVPSTPGGAELLANSSDNDYALLRLRRAPPRTVTALRWSLEAPTAGEDVTCIHHPEGGLKRISLGESLGETMYYWPVLWHLGVTQPGSSGSPLLNARGELIGLLSGGYDGPGSSCENPDFPDQFGRFDVVYATAARWFGRSTDPLPGIAKGLYEGLFYDPNQGRNPASAGAMTIKTTDKGKFTGRAWLGGSKASFKGAWDINGESEVMLRRKYGGPALLRLYIDPADPSTISGTVSDGTFAADIVAHRVSADGRTRIAPQMGQYTMVIAGVPGSPTLPAGEGYGTVKVDRAGRLRFVGSLADGTKVSQSAYITEADEWSLYLPLYGGRGLLMSGIAVGPDPAQGMSGEIAWVKPPGAGGTLYPGGFDFVTRADGAAYTRPAKGQSALPEGEAWLALSGQEKTFYSPLGIGPGNRIVNLGEDKLKLKFAAASGLFSGVLSRADTGARLRFGGVVFQPDGAAYGYFAEQNRSGAVVIGR